MKELIVIGGGLAGCEAAWQAAKSNVKVVLYEMRPTKFTEAHKTGLLGELVCSNSLRSADPMSATGLLKRELQMADSLIMAAAEAARVPAGSAFAVDRAAFAGFITEAISDNENIRVVREEVREIPDTFSIVATGPLTSEAMADALRRLMGSEYLSFYDAIAPILDAESIDYEKVFFASRYGKGGDDYINCPMTREEYEVFYDALLEADRVNRRAFEDEKVFESCMPVEVMALRGRDTMRFGPMKPVGLKDPRTGRDPFAVVQLRQENNEKTAYNMVGFQTRLIVPEQKRVFRLIPGLEHAEFLRFGSIHRNTFINSPFFVDRDLSLRLGQNVYLAGQITGVEGYIESTAAGLLAGINAARRMDGRYPLDVPPTTAHGSLVRHITSETRDFQPSNINFGLFPQAESDRGDKKVRRRLLVERALEDWDIFVKRAME
ncbi:MAG TPA: methylenetetrahydrofolate--tRNA-(uracil(54)-C(5))-methyltransferase (FADH(2)-oxidizing) TrmFO [Thermodesulfovibrionales bacterium]|nr:methylenetetrahydrofolate--tRNA-(uracil(54)-C(5))-methyltransferase (FADH(2)-oxidizing) TrmFO [Thermodesulfovibrionales bacterium]